MYKISYVWKRELDVAEHYIYGVGGEIRFEKDPLGKIRFEKDPLGENPVSEKRVREESVMGKIPCGKKSCDGKMLKFSLAGKRRTNRKFINRG